MTQARVLYVGRDLHEGERVRRLLDARVGISRSPSQARDDVRVHGRPDLVLLEDRTWPVSEEEALHELRELFAARKLPLILSLKRGERHDRPEGIPVVERPYVLEELARAVELALLRRRA